MQNLIINDLHDELYEDLYYSSSNRDLSEPDNLPAVQFDADTGTEIGADQVLTPMLTNVNSFSDNVEDDSLCDAALMKQPDSTSTEAYEPEVQSTKHYTLPKSAFITDEDRLNNFNFYMQKVKQARNFYDLKVARESVLTGSKNSNFFMNPTQKAAFWDEYRKIKEILNSNKAVRRTA